MLRDEIKIVVTGSRGKSSVVRLLQEGFLACGFQSYGRITGVIPRTLTPDGFIPVYRNSGANVSEMKWWLSQVQSRADVVILENSAVSPDLQPLAASWMSPDLTVITNVRPDHQDAWGEGELCASKAIFRGVPSGGTVILSPDFHDKVDLLGPLYDKGCSVVIASKNDLSDDYRSSNMALAMEVARFYDLDQSLFLSGMESIKPDIADFTVLQIGSGKLAFAFSANDLETTEELFSSLGWARSETTVLFNHRRDRRERYGAFRGWLKSGWKESVVIGDRPSLFCGDGYLKLNEIGDLMSFVESHGQVLGCGNVVYGLPLELKLYLERKMGI